MRLTKKDIENQLSNINIVVGSRLVGKKLFAEMCNELIEYKDIEDELGIDLITLSKGLMQGTIYVKWNDEIISLNNIGPIEKVYYDENGFEKKDKWCFYWCDTFNVKYNKLEDYGKTWALTKEELEK